MKSENLKILDLNNPPSWMPGYMAEEMQSAVARAKADKGTDRHRGLPLQIRFYDAERRVMRKRKKIPVSSWAERHRYVTTGPYEGTRFKKTTFAYAPAVMDASFYPSVQEIVMCFADQASKSFISDTCIAYAADRSPGPVLFCYPDESTALDNMKDRLQPMFRLSPRLRAYMTGMADDEGQKRINLQHMTIYAAWATSAIKLANKPIKYGVADEVDKYPATAGKTEGTPLDKIRKRLRLYRFDRKLWILSTPTIESGPVWVELNTCDVVFEYRVKCADCGHLHLMDFETDKKWFRWDGEKNPEKIEKDHIGYYVCPACGSIWDDQKRDMAVRLGAWYSMVKTPDGKKEIEGPGVEIVEYLSLYKPRKIGFHLPSWISPAVGISEVCAAFVRGQHDKNKLKDFNNSHAARPWTDFTQDRQEDAILRLRDDRPRGVVPGGGRVQALTAFVDTHGLDERGWFCYEIRAWGWGTPDMAVPESWQIREGQLESFERVADVLWNTRYYDPDGKEYFIALALQDAMGRRTNEVYNFCLGHRGRILPTQGVDSTRMAAPYNFTNLEYFAGSKKAIPGGLSLYRFSNLYFKNILAGKLEVAPGDPGAWHLHAETTEDWARQLCAETIDPKTMQWVQIGSMANHGWDCSVGNILAEEILGLKYIQKPLEAPVQDTGHRDKINPHTNNYNWMKRR